MVGDLLPCLMGVVILIDFIALIAYLNSQYCLILIWKIIPVVELAMPKTYLLVCSFDLPALGTLRLCRNSSLLLPVGMHWPSGKKCPNLKEHKTRDDHRCEGVEMPSLH